MYTFVLVSSNVLTLEYLFNVVFIRNVWHGLNVRCVLGIDVVGEASSVYKRVSVRRNLTTHAKLMKNTTYQLDVLSVYVYGDICSTFNHAF